MRIHWRDLLLPPVARHCACQRRGNGTPAWFKVLLCLPLAILVNPVAALAEDNAFTVFASYRDGGSFTDANTDKSLSIEGSNAFAAALDWGLDGNRQMQLFLSHQRSDLDLDQNPLTPAGNSLPLNVTYLHIGGTVFFDGEIGKGGYLVGGLGATLLEPDQSGLSEELRASMNLGIGYELPLGERLALRFEARGYLTLVNSSGGLFCSGGCVVAIKGEAVTQGELQIGLSYKY